MFGASERLQVEVVRALAGWDAVAAWADDGALTPASWLYQRVPVTETEARMLVRVASLYHGYPEVASALDGGEISLAHARILATAENGHSEMFAACVNGLLGYARDIVRLADFAQVMAEWVGLVDDKAPDDDSERAFRSNDTFGGKAHTEMSGSAEDAAIVRAAIESLDTLDPPDCPEGPRTRSQRHYDIAMDIFRRVLADELGTEPDPIGGADVVLDPQTATDLMAEPDEVDGSLDLGDPLKRPIEERLAEFLDDHSDHGDCDHDRGECRRCEFTTGEKATLAFAAAMLCTGWVRRVIRDPDTGVIVDVGRRHRLFSRTQRRMLVYRDRGCVFPGCDRGPRWCDAHHLKPWDEGGLTDLINGVLLCRRHHRMIHQGWKLARDAATGIVTATSPDGRTFTREPDPPGRRPPVRC